MQIKTFKPVEYKGHKILVRQMGWTFEYLVVVKGEIYAMSCTVRPDLLNRVLCFLRRQESPYSQEQLERLVLRLQQTAQITIDHVLNPEAVKEATPSEQTA